MLKVLGMINSVLGVMDIEPAKPDQSVEELIESREQARKNKDWPTADRLRQKPKDMGIGVIDTKKGPKWHKARD